MVFGPGTLYARLETTRAYTRSSFAHTAACGVRSSSQWTGWVRKRCMTTAWARFQPRAPGPFAHFGQDAHGDRPRQMEPPSA